MQQGLLDHRVETVLREAGTETEAAQERLAALPGTETNAGDQASTAANGIITSGQARGFSVVMAAPVGGRPRWPTAAPSRPSSST